MKNLFILLILAFCLIDAHAQVAVNIDGSLPDNSAMLDVKATGRGFLAPRMTLAQRPASPVVGLLIYQTDNTPGYYFYNGSAWQRVGTAGSDYWLPNGSDIYYSAGRVGVGLTDPDFFGLNVTNYVIGKAAVRGNDQSGANVYATGMLGVLQPQTLGVPINVVNAGVLGIKPGIGGNGAGVIGWNNDVNSINYGSLFVADGINATATNNAVYAEAKGGQTNYAGQFKGRILIEGFRDGEGAADSLFTLLSSQVRHNTFSDTRAIDGYSVPQPGYGIGVYGTGGYRGVQGYANAGNYSGTSYGVFGSTSGTGVGTRIGIYGSASGGATNWGGYFVGSTYMSGDLRIGTTTQATGYSLSVNGKIVCTEVLVQAFGSWPDYVFSPDYNLTNLYDLENSIKENRHLPGIPSAKQIESEGIQVGTMQKMLLEKVEELTLHLINQQKLIDQLSIELTELKSQR